MRKFEYLVMPRDVLHKHYDLPISNKDVQKFLNKQGKEGWQLIGFHDGRYTFIREAFQFFPVTEETKKRKRKIDE